MEKKIIVISNACLDEYENTLVSFRNGVPTNYLTPYKKWALALQSIGISCNFKDNENIPKIVKIVCSNVKPIMKNEGHCHELGSLTLSKENNEKYVIKNFQTLKYLELHSQIPEFIEIKLLDESDNLLKLKSGLNPTFVKLHLESDKMNSDHINLSSHPNSTYNDNNTSKFGVRLAKKLEFFGKNPKIALTSMMIWNQLKLSSDLDLKFEMLINDSSHKLVLPDSIKNVDEVIEYINKELSSYCYLFTTSERHLRIKSKSDLTIVLGRDLAYMLGCTDSLDNPKLEMKLDLREYQVFTSKYRLQNIPLFGTHLYLYCDLVKPSLMGGGLHNFLKAIPISNSNLKDSYYRMIEFEHIEFLPISTTQVEYINFELRTSNGSLLEFSDENVHTYLSIVIKE